MSDVVIGIIAGSVVAIISFVLGLLGNMWYANFQDKKQRQREALKNHFIRLNENVVIPLVKQLQSLKNVHGEISVNGDGRHWSPNDSTLNLNLKDWKSFSVHFSNLAEIVEQTINEINKHNEEYDIHDYLLVEQLNKIRPSHGRFLTPSIFSPELLKILKNTLYQVAENNQKNTKYPITHDFNKATIFQEGEKWILANKPGSSRITYAFSDLEADCNVYKEKLIGIQNSQELLMKTYTLNNNAITLIEKCNNISNALDFLSHSYEKLGKTLEKVEDCYYCQMIFDIS